jgi:hypothetical protein
MTTLLIECRLATGNKTRRAFSKPFVSVGGDPIINSVHNRPRQQPQQQRRHLPSATYDVQRRDHGSAFLQALTVFDDKETLGIECIQANGF